MSPTKKIAALFVTVFALVLCVVPIASAHTPVLTATLDCNGTISWTLQSNGFNATFSLSDSNTGDEGTHALTGGEPTGGPEISTSGTYTVPSGVTSGTLTATINWADGDNFNSIATATYSAPTNCQSTPAISTNASGPATVGQQIHDVATLSGAKSATGAVTFQVFGPNDPTCATPLATLLTSSSNVDGNGNGTYTSQSYTTTKPGTYLWVASFAGDANNTAVSGSCGAEGESSTVTQATPQIPTDASGPVTVGGSITDVATLSGAVAATGAVTFEVFGPSDTTCTQEPVATLLTASKTVDGNGNGTYTSQSYTTTAPGTYHWRAFFAGDTNNAAVSGACNAEGESSTVNQASPSISTQATGSTTTGNAISDVATLSGAVNASGAVTFELFGTSDSTCSQAPIATLLTASKAVDANGNGTYTSATYTPQSAGTYHWRAFFAGDANNAAVSDACNAPNEATTVTSPSSPPVTPSSPSIGITKNPKSQTIASGATANFTITVTNTGNVTLTNVTVTDALSPACNASSSTIPALASMASGATVTYNCSLADVTASFTNSATATGTPPSGPNVTATDTAPVTVTPPTTPPTPKPPTPKPAPTPVPTHPSISIVKDPSSQTVAVGGTATFNITVTNTGDVTLSDVTVDDPLSTDCSRSLGTLAVGQSKSYSCTKQNVTADFVNVASATGKPPTGSDVKAADHASVSAKPFVPPSLPRIAIVKSPKSQTLTTKVTRTTMSSGATKTVVHYGTAHFTIKVTNDGNVTLHAVKVDDASSPACTHELGSLAAGASKEYSCSRSAVAMSFTNTAIVVGTSPTGKKVTATDHAHVTVKVKTTSTSGAKFTG